MTDKPVEEEARAYVSEEKGVKNVAEALNGAKDIIAERISDEADYRIYIRNLTTKNGSISSTAMNSRSRSGNWQDTVFLRQTVVRKRNLSLLK